MNSELYQRPIGEEEAEPDGRDNWWANYKESDVVDNARISLRDNLQHKWFTQVMDTLDSNKMRLSDYDRNLHATLTESYRLFGRGAFITRKQMEYIKQVAFDFEKGA